MFFLEARNPLPPELISKALTDNSQSAIVWEIPKGDSRFLPRLEKVPPLPWAAGVKIIEQAGKMIDWDETVDLLTKIVKKVTTLNDIVPPGSPPICNCNLDGESTPAKCAEAGGYDMVIVGASGVAAIKTFERYAPLVGGEAVWTYFSPLTMDAFSGWGCKIGIDDSSDSYHYIFWLGPDKWPYEYVYGANTSTQAEEVSVEEAPAVVVSAPVENMTQPVEQVSTYVNPFLSQELIDQMASQGECVETLGIQGVRKNEGQGLPIIYSATIDVGNNSGCAWNLDPSVTQLVVDGLPPGFNYAVRMNGSLLPNMAGNGYLIVYQSKDGQKGQVEADVSIRSTDGRVIVNPPLHISFFNPEPVVYQPTASVSAYPMNNQQNDGSSPVSDKSPEPKNDEVVFDGGKLSDELSKLIIPVLGVSGAVVLILFVGSLAASNRNRLNNNNTRGGNAGGGDRRVASRNYSLRVDDDGFVNREDVDMMRNDFQRDAQNQVAAIERQSQKQLEKHRQELQKQAQQEVERNVNEAKRTLEGQLQKRINEINRQSSDKLTAEQRKLRESYQRELDELKRGYQKKDQQRLNELQERTNVLNQQEKDLRQQAENLKKREEELAREQERAKKLADQLEEQLRQSTAMLDEASSLRQENISTTQPQPPSENKSGEPIEETNAKASENNRVDMGRVLDHKTGAVSIPSHLRVVKKKA